MREARPTIAFLPAHPSQLWMLRPVAEATRQFANPVWILRDKDCTVQLAEALELEFEVLSRAATGLWGNALEMAANIVRALRLTQRLGIDLWVTKYGAANTAARLLGRRSIAFNDDDADIVPLVAWTSYPFAEAILAPTMTRMGRFESKTIRYRSCHELFYLHPARFEPDVSVREDLGLMPDERFAVVRLSSLRAHHDVLASGVTDDLLRSVIALAERHRIRVLVSSEDRNGIRAGVQRLNIEPHRMHHALAFAEFFLGDSQTMTAEATVLGTPSFQLSSFAGRIAYIEDLRRYDLAFTFPPGHERALLESLEHTLVMPDRQDVLDDRRRRLLADKVDPVPMFADIIRGACHGASISELQELAARESHSRR